VSEANPPIIIFIECPLTKLRNGPARAKSDLQKQMAARSVRKSIANAILSGIGLGSVEPETASSTRPISRAERSISVMSSRSHAMEQTDDG
jgi:CLIP-associating protein 1/2